MKRVLFVLVISILLKIFVLDVFHVPSGSMENTLYSGDYLYVNKLYFGSRIPKSLDEVPWVNFFYFLFSSNKGEKISFQQNVRTWGYSKIKRNDILVFNDPHFEPEYLVKRCIALPRDTLRIDDTLITINGRKTLTPVNVKLSYDVEFSSNEKCKTALRNLKIEHEDDWFHRSQLVKQLTLSGRQKLALLASGSVLSIRRKRDAYEGIKAGFKDSVVGEKKHAIETVIPFKGMTILLDTFLFKRYGHLINNYEHAGLTCEGGKFYDERKIQRIYYTFKLNYYFMMGDNRDFSVDSRTWGLVPEFCLVGKVSFVLFSTYSNFFNRFIMSVN